MSALDDLDDARMRRRAVHDSAQADSARWQLYAHGVHGIEQDFEEEALDPERPTESDTARHVAYLYGLEECIRESMEEFGDTPQEIINEAWAAGLDTERYFRDFVSGELNEDKILEFPRNRRLYIEEKRRDLQENYLYTEYFYQLTDPRVRHPVRTYTTYCLVTALKAGLVLVAQRFHGWEMLRDYHPKVFGMPDRQLAIYYLQTKLLNGPYEAFIADVSYEVPGIIAAAETLLKLYSEGVRIEWGLLLEQGERVVNDTDLPDDPGIWKVMRSETLEARLEAAIEEYAGGVETSVKALAFQHGVNNETLRRALKERGLSRQRGPHGTTA